MTGTVTYDAANQLATLQHTDLFPQSATCQATITTAVKDINDIAMASDYVWSFETGTASDASAPTVLSLNPLNGALNVCLSSDLKVVFSEPMDTSTINANTLYVTSPPNVPVAGALTYDSLTNTAIFSVTNPPGFTAGITYTTHITTGVKDLAGLPMALAQVATFTTGTQACAPVPAVALGTVATYGAFGGSAGTTNSGIYTVVQGDLGTTAACTLFTGFHNSANVYTETNLNIGQVTGSIYCGPPAPGTPATLVIATQAATDARTAYNALAAKSPSTLLGPVSGELGGLTVLPGVYTPYPSSFIISSGNLTLDAGGNPDAVWIFQVPSSLTMGLIATPRSVLLTNGAQAKNVYWQVGSAARIENGSTMVGTIIANHGVTISTAGQTALTTLTGRAISLNASVTMVNTAIVSP